MILVRKMGKAGEWGGPVLHESLRLRLHTVANDLRKSARAHGCSVLEGRRAWFLNRGCSHFARTSWES